MKKIKQFLALLLLVFSAVVYAQTNYCVSGCNDNSFLNSHDPNTIEYDNMIGLYHSTLIKEANGTVKVWGASSASNGSNHNLAPVAVTPGNGYNYQGSILKMTGGSSGGINAQFAILTTAGLYVWGAEGLLINDDLTTNTAFHKFQNIGTYNQTGTSAFGLPKGVNPADVKMMFGTYQALAIVTCTGEAWVLAYDAPMFGDGAPLGNNNQNRLVWHRVSTDTAPLTNVVAVRGTGPSLMALTSSGEVYVWGSTTYLGNNAGSSSRSTATKMDLTALGLSATKKVKMIGATSNTSYFILTSDGEVWGLGENSARELGMGNSNTTDQNNWQRTQLKTNGIDDKIAWISPNEHSAGNGGSKGYGAVNALTTDGKLWAWGANDSRMLGGGNDSQIDPTAQPGGLAATDRLLAVETGGHTTMVIKQCSKRYGYVGHKVYGSMGDGSTTDTTVNTFNFAQTAEITLCGSPTSPVVKDLKICPGTTADLSNANLEATPSDIVWHTGPIRTSSVVANPDTVTAGTYYAFFTTASGKCPDLFSTVVVSDYLPTDPEFESCTSACYNPAYKPGTGPDTKLGITLLKRAGAGNADNWPMARKSGHIALESNTKGFVVTRIAKADLGKITSPQEGMMVYDTTDKCLKIYADGAWACFSNPACP